MAGISLLLLVEGWWTRTPKGVHVVEQATMIFDGNTEYYLLCQFTPEHAEEMRQGCTQVLESFKVE